MIFIIRNYILKELIIMKTTLDYVFKNIMKKLLQK